MAINIHKCIKKALIERNSIIIPGLGGLIIERKPAGISSGNQLTPPTNILIFNEKMGYPDETLVSYIAELSKSDTATSSELLSSFIADVKKTLEEKHEYTLEGLGKITKNTSGILGFIAEETSKMPEFSSGFDAIYVQPLKPVEEKKVSLPDPEKAKEEKKIIATNTVNSTPSPTGRKKNWVWPVTIAAFLIGIIAGSYFLFLKDQLFPATDDSLFADIIDSVETETHDSLSDIDTDNISFSKFYIVAGSFRNYQNASILLNIMKKKGYPAEIIESGTDFYRVVLNSYDNKEQALIELEKIRKKNRDSQAWLLGI